MTDKMHPDDVVKALSELAKSHGYGLVKAELVGLVAVGSDLPKYTYGHEVIEVPSMDGTVRRFMVP